MSPALGSLLNRAPVAIANDARQYVRGPAAGSYWSANIGINTVAASQSDLEIGAIECPADLRIEEISLSCTTSTGGASRALIQVTDGTNDLLSADTLLVSGGSATVNASSTGLVEDERDRSKGDRLQVDVTTVAGEVVTALNVLITGYIRGHVQTLASDD